MNILVCVKQVPDTETQVRPESDGQYIQRSNIKWVMNPYDEFAVEQALLIKKDKPDANVTVIRVGATCDTEALRTAMAMGADQAIWVDTNEILDSYQTALAIFQACKKTNLTPDIILAGKQAVDDDCLQVPQILAEFFNVPHISVIVKFEMKDNSVKAIREIEGGGQEVYEVALPVLLTCNKSLNTPRYPSLPGIIKAKKKPMTTYTLGDLGISEQDRKVKYSNFRLPPAKPAGKKFDAMDSGKQSDVVNQVISLLRNEAKAL